MILIDIRAFGNILGHSVTLRAATVGPPPVVVKCTLSMVKVGHHGIFLTISPHAHWQIVIQTNILTYCPTIMTVPFSPY